MSDYDTSLTELEQYLGLAREKRAQDELAAASDGDADGSDASAHPVMDADPQTVKVQEGERASENESDVASDVPGQDINTAPKVEAGKEPQPVSMTNAATTGKDPANETSGVKHEKDDPGTSHPAEMNGEESGKTAAYIENIKKACDEKGLEKVAAALIEDITSDVVKAAETLNEEQIKQAEYAGREAANSLFTFEKDVEQLVSHISKEASVDADRVISYYQGLAKAAAEEGQEEEAPAEAPAEGTEEGALPPEDLAAMAAAAGEGAPGADEAAAVGDEAAAALPEDPAMDEAAAMEASMGAEDPAVVEALSMALDEAGITPEELVQAIEAEQAGLGAEVPVEEKMANVQLAKRAAAQVCRQRDLARVGRWKNQKRAGIELQYAVRQIVKKATGK